MLSSVELMTVVSDKPFTYKNWFPTTPNMLQSISNARSFDGIFRSGVSLR